MPRQYSKYVTGPDNSFELAKYNEALDNEQKNYKEHVGRTASERELEDSQSKYSAYKSRVGNSKAYMYGSMATGMAPLVAKPLANVLTKHGIVGDNFANLTLGPLQQASASIGYSNRHLKQQYLDKLQAQGKLSKKEEVAKKAFDASNIVSNASKLLLTGKLLHTAATAAGSGAMTGAAKTAYGAIKNIPDALTTTKNIFSNSKNMSMESMGELGKAFGGHVLGAGSNATLGGLQTLFSGIGKQGIAGAASGVAKGITNTTAPIKTFGGMLPSSVGLGLAGLNFAASMVLSKKLALPKPKADPLLKEFARLSPTPSINSQLQVAIGSKDKSINASTQLQIFALSAIADISARSLPFLPKIYDVLDRTEQNKDKSVDDVDHEYDEIKKGKGSSLGIFGKSLAGVNNFLQEKTFKYNPVTQLMHTLFTGELPKTALAKFKRKNFETTDEKKSLRKQELTTGISVPTLRLIGLDSSMIRTRFRDPQAIQLGLLSGIYDLSRHSTKELITMRSGMGIHENMFHHGLSASFEKGIFGTLAESIGSTITNIPGINAITNSIKSVINLPKTIFEGSRKAFAFAKEKLFGKEFLELQDDTQLDKKMGIYKSMQEKATEFIAKAFPHELKKQTNVAYEQLAIQQNMYDVLNMTYQLQSGESHEEKKDLYKDERKKTVYDHVTGKYYDLEVFEKIVLPNRKEKRTETLRGAWDKSIIGKLLNPWGWKKGDRDATNPEDRLSDDEKRDQIMAGQRKFKIFGKEIGSAESLFKRLHKFSGGRETVYGKEKEEAWESQKRLDMAPTTGVEGELYSRDVAKRKRELESFGPSFMRGIKDKIGGVGSVGVLGAGALLSGLVPIAMPLILATAGAVGAVGAAEITKRRNKNVESLDKAQKDEFDKLKDTTGIENYGGMGRTDVKDIKDLVKEPEQIERSQVSRRATGATTKDVIKKLDVLRTSMNMISSNISTLQTNVVTILKEAKDNIKEFKERLIPRVESIRAYFDSLSLTIEKAIDGTNEILKEILDVVKKLKAEERPRQTDRSRADIRDILLRDRQGQADDFEDLKAAAKGGKGLTKALVGERIDKDGRIGGYPELVTGKFDVVGQKDTKRILNNMGIETLSEGTTDQKTNKIRFSIIDKLFEIIDDKKFDIEFERRRNKGRISNFIRDKKAFLSDKVDSVKQGIQDKMFDAEFESRRNKRNGLDRSLAKELSEVDEKKKRSEDLSFRDKILDSVGAIAKHTGLLKKLQEAKEKLEKKDGWFGKLTKWLLPLLAPLGAIIAPVLAGFVAYQTGGKIGGKWAAAAASRAGIKVAGTKVGTKITEKIAGTKVGGILAKGVDKVADWGVKGAEALGKIPVVGKLFETIGPKLLSKMGIIIGKGGLKSALKKIPILGAVVGTGFAIQRLTKGDIIGAVGEFASGIASLFPGVGTLVSLGIDGLLMLKDMKSEKDAKTEKPTKSMWQSIKDFFKRTVANLLGTIPFVGPWMSKLIFGEEDLFKDADIFTGTTKKVIDTVRGSIEWLITNNPIVGAVLFITDQLRELSVKAAQEIKEGFNTAVDTTKDIGGWIKNFGQVDDSDALSEIAEAKKLQKENKKRKEAQQKIQKDFNVDATEAKKIYNETKSMSDAEKTEYTKSYMVNKANKENKDAKLAKLKPSMSPTAFTLLRNDPENLQNLIEKGIIKESDIGGYKYVSTNEDVKKSIAVEKSKELNVKKTADNRKIEENKASLEVLKLKLSEHAFKLLKNDPSQFPVLLEEGKLKKRLWDDYYILTAEGEKDLEEMMKGQEQTKANIQKGMSSVSFGPQSQGSPVPTSQHNTSNKQIDVPTTQTSFSFSTQEQPNIPSSGQSDNIPINDQGPGQSDSKPTDGSLKTTLTAMGINPSLAGKYSKPLEDTMDKHNIDSSLRESHFLSQVLHESGGLKYNTELASGAAYEGRKDLGNTQPGDGVKFKGRGLIQLTGRDNYDKFGKYIGQDLLDNPEIIASDPGLSAEAAGWFWDKKNLNSLADNDDAYSVTKRINGGLNGIDDRLAYLDKAKTQLGTKTESASTPPQTADVSDKKETSKPDGDFKWPSIHNVITSPFGPRQVAKGSSNHQGIDIRAKTGDPIYASMSGTVSVAKLKPWGNVTIDHGNGITTRYLHNSGIVVKAGDHVNAGDLIANAGGMGKEGASSYTPHLHYEVIKNGQKVDPELFINSTSPGFSPQYAGIDPSRQLTAKLKGIKPKVDKNKTDKEAADDVEDNSGPGAIGQFVADLGGWGKELVTKGVTAVGEHFSNKYSDISNLSPDAGAIADVAVKGIEKNRAKIFMLTKRIISDNKLRKKLLKKVPLIGNLIGLGEFASNIANADYDDKGFAEGAELFSKKLALAAIGQLPIVGDDAAEMLNDTIMNIGREGGILRFAKHGLIAKSPTPVVIGDDPHGEMAVPLRPDLFDSMMDRFGFKERPISMKGLEGLKEIFSELIDKVVDMATPDTTSPKTPDIPTNQQNQVQPIIMPINNQQAPSTTGLEGREQRRLDENYTPTDPSIDNIIDRMFRNVCIAFETGLSNHSFKNNTVHSFF